MQMPRGGGRHSRAELNLRAEGRHGVSLQSYIVTCVMANIQSSLQEIRETGVIANTCRGLSLSF